MVPNKKFFLSITLIFIIANLFLLSSAEASSQTWSKTYGGNVEDEQAWSMVETSDGGYAMAGYTTVGAGYISDFLLIKTDEFGNMEWNQTYGGIIHDEQAYSLVATSDGGYAMAGYTNPFGAASFDFWLVKTDAAGNMEWNQTYGGNESERASSLVETSDGGYAMAGDTNPFGSGKSDFWLVKVDSEGNMLWNQTYGGTDSEHAGSVVQTGDGGYAIAGYTYSFGAGGYDFWLVKTDEFGDMEWNQTYGGNESQHAESLVVTSDGGYAIVGNTVVGTGVSVFLLIKTDEFGNMEWNQTDRVRKGIDVACSLVEASDGGYAIAGITRFLNEEADIVLVKTYEMGVTTEFPLWIILLSPLIAILIVIVIILIYKKQRKNKS